MSALRTALIAIVALWRTNGTALGTVKVAEIADGPTGAGPRSITQFGSKLFFFANEEATGLELHSLSPSIEYRVNIPRVLR